MSDQIIKLTAYTTSKKYPDRLRRVIFYVKNPNRTFVYLTNNMEITAEQVALLYKYRWQIELFYKWIKQHLKIKAFWGTTETALRIQIYTSITTYCLVAIVEHDLKLGRSTFEIIRVLSVSLLDKTPLKDILYKQETIDKKENHELQLSINF
ncbi:hypothetical protein EZS27_032256 [termite gut metagenome]|uniref:Transposase IS4-like domain-containing protein n=1 Tax=termite gut metagenome TaxID=433724 RepID=A0A5J4QAL7_9ZZZZ